MNLKCIAIDDEPIALAIIRQFCQRMDGLDLETFTNPVDGMERVRQICPDILFLDIELNGLSGIDLARGLSKEVALIFTTAYSKFALDGFELDAVDFLHKPFSFSRFERAILKAKERISLHKFVREQYGQEKEITLKVEYKNMIIHSSDIAYIEAMDNYTRVYLFDKKPVLSQTSMKGMLELLPTEDFIRVHKSFIVPVSQIVSYTRRMLVLNYRQVQIPIGRVYVADFLERMSRNALEATSD